MFTQYLFILVTRLIFSRLARGFTEHHGVCETAYFAHIGPLCLEVKHCHVLDHEDVAIGTQIPTFWGRLELTYLVCRGEDQIRKPGFNFVWWPVANRNRPKQMAVPEDDFPF
jgi:hypothetical protein